jgi:hypothetical protein
VDAVLTVAKDLNLNLAEVMAQVDTGRGCHGTRNHAGTGIAHRVVLLATTAESIHLLRRMR